MAATDDKRSGTVLIVDDEEELRELLTFIFKSKGHEVVLASGGHEALRLLRQNPVDVVVSDVRMPEGDGLELLEAIAAEPALARPVILITGFADLDPAEAHGLGAYAVLTKPFPFQDLLALVERSLAERAAP